MQNGRAEQNTRRFPARPENYCESKQTYFSYSLNKAFHSPKFQAKLFFTRNWGGGFYWDSLFSNWVPLSRALKIPPNAPCLMPRPLASFTLIGALLKKDKGGPVSNSSGVGKILASNGTCLSRGVGNLNDTVKGHKYLSLSKKMRKIVIPVVHTINRKTWWRASVVGQ